MAIIFNVGMLWDVKQFKVYILSAKQPDKRIKLGPYSVGDNGNSQGVTNGNYTEISQIQPGRVGSTQGFSVPTYRGIGRTGAKHQRH